MNGKEIPPLVVANNTLLQNDESEMTPPSFPTICFRRVVSFYFANEFIVLVVLSILLAKAYPPLGNEYVQPDITASWIAVIIIFSTYCCSLVATTLKRDQMSFTHFLLHDDSIRRTFSQDRRTRQSITASVFQLLCSGV